MKFTSSNEDLDYADDLALLARNHQDIQKSNKLDNINANQTKVIHIKCILIYF